MYNNVIEVNSSVLYTWNLLRLYVLSILSKKKGKKMATSWCDGYIK